MDLWWAIIIASGLTLVDQLLKWWVTMHLTQTLVLIPGILSLTDVKNSGAAWSMLEHQQAFFLGLAVIAVILIGYYLWKVRYDWRYSLALALLLAGTLGNAISRSINGTVVDMFQCDFVNFPIFNVADVCLTLGVMILIILVWSDQKIRSKASK